MHFEKGQPSSLLPIKRMAASGSGTAH